jgi:mannose/fructose/N-acetylgalactosamine-specific phosphotransferase system component IIB
MSVVLLRIDERLIHGQVVVGWGSQLNPDRIIVIDDEIAASEWEQELYRLGLPADTAADFRTVEQARASLPTWREAQERMILLARSVETVHRLGRGGLLRGAEVNLGGIHHAPERREVLPYLFLSNAEADALRELAGQGAEISARDLPAARRVPLSQLLPGGASS